MIDKENEVYSRVNEIVMNAYPDASMDSSYQAVPSGFPHITLEQTNSYTPIRLDVNTAKEKYTTITVTVNVYSNKTSGKKQECKNIMGLIDDAMRSMNFRRLVMTPVPNLNDSSIYRMTAEYEVTASDTYFYRS